MTFEFDGNQYAKASSFQKQLGSKLIAELDLRGDESILDLGCGDGALTAQLADLVPNGRVLGLDASKGMIEAAHNHHRTNLSFQLQNIDDLDFKSEFDIVFSNAALHWVKDHRLLLINTFAALRSNGVLRFNFAADGNCPHFLNVIGKAMNHPNYSRYFKHFVWPWFMPPVEKYEELFNRFSFREQRIWTENKNQYFLNTNAMAAWIDQPSIVPILLCVDEPDKQSFRNDVVDRMIEDTIQEDGTCLETFRRINAFARK